MTNEEMLTEISRALAVLALQTAAENQGGLFSKNRLTEDLILPVFQIVFATPDLKNANDGVNNYAHVDLIAKESRIAIQVTTERTSSKVSGTLTGFFEDHLEREYDRLIIFILTMNPPNFQKATRVGWTDQSQGKLAFDPARDIITPTQLYPLIQSLERDQLEDVYKIVVKSVLGKEFIDVESQLENISKRALAYEMATGKYIPEVFMETDRTKQRARMFCHPVLFLERHLERTPVAGIRAWNEFLQRIGQGPLPLPEIESVSDDRTLEKTVQLAGRVALMFSKTLAAINVYGKGGDREAVERDVPPAAQAFFEQNSWKLVNDLGFGFRYRVEEFIAIAETAAKRFCLLTGTAGQGKTNFICDLVDTFLLNHGIPTGYVSVRKLALRKGTSLGSRLASMLFDQKIESFSECAKLISESAARNNKPFVLVLDGLNEHPNGTLFAQELEDLLHELSAYPHLRVLMTCRSEFFDQRFGNLLHASFKNEIVRYEVWGRNFDPIEQEDLTNAYFRFFRVSDSFVSEDVIKRLQDDVLLLRFFCEAYGARNKPEGYQQPRISSIQRDEIFDIYLNHKLEAMGNADALAGEAGSRQVAPGKTVSEVLSICLQYMLDNWQFDNVPVKIIPTHLTLALERLLEEELIVRRDAPGTAGFFSPTDETLNFTFDEFRDFLLAQYLVQNVFASDKSKFEQYISKTNPVGAPTIEGLKRFLFFIGRKHGDSEFRGFYKAQPWYKDVYQEEVFNLPSELLDAEDADAVRAYVQHGDSSAIRSAVRLAINWHSGRFPFLNLDLLLSLISESGDDFYRSVVVTAFTSKTYGGNGASAEAFATFLEQQILPSFDFDRKSPQHSLFRFLCFLLPIDSDFNLNSPAFNTMKAVLPQNPEYIVSTLLDSLEAHFTMHHPYVWRLLGQGAEIKRSVRAEKVAKSFETEVLSDETRRELNRFLSIVAKRYGGVDE